MTLECETEMDIEGLPAKQRQKWSETGPHRNVRFSKQLRQWCKQGPPPLPEDSPRQNQPLPGPPQEPVGEETMMEVESQTYCSCGMQYGASISGRQATR